MPGDGRPPSEPIAAPLASALSAVARDRMVFEGRPGPSAHDLVGTLRGGRAVTPLGSATDCAVARVLPSGVP